MAILYLLSSALQKDIMMAADNKQGKKERKYAVHLETSHQFVPSVFSIPLVVGLLSNLQQLYLVVAGT